MRTADISTETLYAAQTRFAGKHPARVLTRKAWFKYEGYNQPNIYAPERGIPVKGYSQPYNGTTQGLPVLVARAASWREDHARDIEMLNAAHEVVAPLFDGSVHRSMDEVRDAILAKLGEEDSRLISIEMLRPQGLVSEWGSYVERSEADREAERQARSAEAARQAEQERERDAGMAMVAQYADDSDLTKVRTRSEYSDMRVEMPWPVLRRLLDAARGAGRSEASEARSETC